MLYPRLFTDNFFDDLMNFEFPALPKVEDTEKTLYGKHGAHLMRTDVREHDDHYEIDIDLPGFKKEDLKVELHHGNLVISAAKSLDKDEKDGTGKMIRQERYSGSMQRSFYVGNALTEEDIAAKYEDGVLKLNVPKKDAKEVPEKKQILIEG